MAAQPCPLFRHFEQPRSTCTLAPVHFVFGLFLTIRVQLNRFSLVFPFPKDSSHSSSGYATKKNDSFLVMRVLSLCMNSSVLVLPTESLGKLWLSKIWYCAFQYVIVRVSITTHRLSMFNSIEQNRNALVALIQYHCVNNLHLYMFDQIKTMCVYVNGM